MISDNLAITIIICLTTSIPIFLYYIYKTNENIRFSKIKDKDREIEQLKEQLQKKIEPIDTKLSQEIINQIKNKPKKNKKRKSKKCP